MGALDCAVTNTHCAGCIKSGCSDKYTIFKQPALPDGAALGSGSGAILAWQVYGPVMCGLQLRTLRFRRCHRRPAHKAGGKPGAEISAETLS